MSTNFLAHILKSYQIDIVLDFTSIRKLYEADPITVAICATAKRTGKWPHHSPLDLQTHDQRPMSAFALNSTTMTVIVSSQRLR